MENTNSDYIKLDRGVTESVFTFIVIFFLLSLRLFYGNKYLSTGLVNK